MRKTTVDRGVVDFIERAKGRPTYVILISYFEGDEPSRRVPVYANVSKDYLGRCVDIITIRKSFLSFFKRRVEQTIESSDDLCNEIDLPYSTVEKIRRAERKALQQMSYI